MNNGSLSHINIADDQFELVIGKLRFELTDADSDELLEDFWIAGSRLNATILHDSVTGQIEPTYVKVVEFSEVGFVNKTPYMHKEAEIP